MSEVIQFDKSDIIVGGANITEAIREDKKLIFNESYTLVGHTDVKAIYACYDLTVLGDISADEIEVQGTLFVKGNIKAGRLSCQKNLVCQGDITADHIIGDDIIANNITCSVLFCSGSVFARMTVDAAEKIEIERTIVSGEGIIGNGSFSAGHAVAVEFFEFAGSVKGKVIDLGSGTLPDTSGKPLSEVTELTAGSSWKDWTFEEIASSLKEFVIDGLKEAGNTDEDALLEYIRKLSAADSVLVSDWEWLTSKLVELSYLDEITNLKDYLYIVMAKKVLPPEITGYETLEHIFGSLLHGCESRIRELDYHAKDIRELAYSIKIVMVCEDETGMEKEELLDRIFQSVGIKYKTVETFLSKY